jgi:hypothetical protein
MIVGYTYRHTDRWEGFMKCTVKVDSGAIIYIPTFIKIGSASQKLVAGEVHRHTCSIKVGYFSFA